jgi:hypothetical protein
MELQKEMEGEKGTMSSMVRLTMMVRERGTQLRKALPNGTVDSIWKEFLRVRRR